MNRRTLLVLLANIAAQFTPPAKPPRKLIVIYSPAWCPACKSMRAAYALVGFEFGDSELDIEWRESEHPVINGVQAADAYPFIVNPETKRFLERKTDGKQYTLNDLRHFAGLEVR